MRGSTPGALGALLAACRATRREEQRRASGRSRSWRSLATGCCRAPTTSPRASPTPIAGAPRSPAPSPRSRSCLLLDEPTAGMNPAETLELAEQIKSLHQLGLTDRADRAQARCRGRASPTRSSCSTTARRSPKAMPAEVRRDEEVIRAYLGRSAALPEGVRFSNSIGGRHPLRRSACAEIGRLPDRGGRDRLPAWAATPRASRRR